MRRSGGPAIEELAKEGDSGAVKFRVSMYLCISYLYIWCPFSAIFIIGFTFALDQKFKSQLFIGPNETT